MKYSHLLLVLFIATRLVGAESAPPEHNSALQYWIAFAVLPNKEPDWLAAMRADEHAPADNQAEQRTSSALRYLHLGAACAGGSFGSMVGTEAMGSGALLPHIGSARMLGRLAIARATWRFEHDRRADAIEDCVSTLALAVDLSNRACVLEVLVSCSLQSKGLTTIARHLPSCTPDERTGLIARLRDLGLRPRHSDFMRSEAAAWRYHATRPEEFALFSQLLERDGPEKSASAVNAAVMAAVQANDPRFTIWSRDAEGCLAEMASLIELPRTEFLAKQALLMQSAEANPLLQLMAPSMQWVFEVIRTEAVRGELLLAAAKAFDQAGGLGGLAGLQTREGPVTVNTQGTVTVLQVVRLAKEKAIELSIGRR